jgi:L-asparaginase/Glu-tRNA(Gln) amidotransferase subunit D
MWPRRTIADVERVRKELGVEIVNAFSDGVVVVSAVPGLEADMLQETVESKKTRAIILTSLGVGNVPSLPDFDGKYNLIPVISRATKELGKPVIITSPFVGGDTNLGVYEPGEQAKLAGAIDAGKMTAEATLVKTRLLLAQSQFGSSVPAFQRGFTTDFAGETGKL